MIQPKNETEDLLLSITKNCEMLIKQTHRKAEETLEFKPSQRRHTFQFNPPLSLESSWEIRLPSLEVYNSIFNITEEHNKFKLYILPDTCTADISYTKVIDEIERDLGITDITATDLQADILGPIIIKEYNG